MTTKQSVAILIVFILLVGGFFRLVKLWEIEKAKAQELEPKVEQLKKENENLKNENILLKKEVSLPIRNRVISEIRKVFRSRAQEALAVVQCENNPFKPNYNSYSINYNKDGSRDHGIFQINDLWVKVYGSEFIEDWRANIATAKRIFDRSGDWRHWSASVGCHGLLARK